MNKRVWIINQFANTNNMPGHTRQYELSSFLSKKGFEVSVFASDFNLSLRSYLKKGKLFFYKKETINKVFWIWLSVTKYKKNNWKRYLNIFSFDLNLLIHLFIKNLISLISKNKPSIIIASSPQLPATLCALVIAKVFRIPFILEIRDLWPVALIELGNFKKDNVLIKFLFLIEKILYLKSDAVVVLSKGCLNYIESKGAKEIIYLPNGSNLNFFKFHPLPSEDNGFSSKRPFKIIYSGAHGIANGLENVIYATNYLKNLPIEIHLIGNGPEKNKLQLLAKGNKLIIFHDSVPKKQMPEYLSKADAVLISLANVNLFRYGVSPNKLFDAYASGRPVITTVPGLINLEVEKYKLGVTCKASAPEELAKAIIRLYKKTRNEREKIAESARAHAETYYSKDYIFEKYYNLIDKIICGL